MRKILLLFVFSFSFLTSFAVTKADADALYEKEQYRDAVEAYETLMKQGGVAAEVYYNLGNCYYKLDEIPLAVLNYERAFLLDPGDADIRANLALARGKTIDKVVPPSEMFCLDNSWCFGIYLDACGCVGVYLHVTVDGAQDWSVWCHGHAGHCHYR